MFEIVEAMSRRDRIVRAVRRAFSLRACVGMTRATRLTRAALWLVLGVAIAIGAREYDRRHYPAQVTMLTPVVEHVGERFTVIRFRFEHQGVESACHMKIYNDERTWSATC